MVAYRRLLSADRGRGILIDKDPSKYCQLVSV